MSTGEDTRPLPGDELLPDARGQRTHAITVRAQPEEVWPWLVQMGCQRAGFYSVDVLDNAWHRSAREIHPELQHLAVGDMIPATPSGSAGFEVLRVDPPHALVVGGLYDSASDRQLRFGAPRPPRYWHISWAFVLEPHADGSTRLITRVRGAFPDTERLHAAWAVPLHTVMETAQLRHLAARVEGRTRRDDWRDVGVGVAGAATMVGAMALPYLRGRRHRWGTDGAVEWRHYRGDELIPRPRWGWTHSVDVDAPADAVWPWLAQLGADRGGFYSYQWLENVIGCRVRNAETVHPEWALHRGDAFVLHPDGPPMTVVDLEPGRLLLVHGPADPQAVQHGKPWMAATWLLLVEPLGAARCRVTSRFRCTTSDDVVGRVAFGPGLGQAVGGTMDRRMLRGIRRRAEAAHSAR